ncbi:hypothetical protein KSS87_021190 [Heliosperma pusillum]|nr:hypothetical protein KSS87_021190 [Heliosperma pusillum]
MGWGSLSVVGEWWRGEGGRRVVLAAVVVGGGSGGRVVVALTCMAKLRDHRFLYPAGLNSDAIACVDVIMFKQLSNGACLSILFKLTLAVLRHDSSEALRRRQYALLLSYFQYCQHMLDPDVPRRMVQLLLGTDHNNEEVDLGKIDKEQAELARSNFSILQKEAQAILDLVIKDATQGSESGKTISHFVLDALICVDHEKFFLNQLQSRGFLRSCLMSISNFSHQDGRRAMEALRACTLEAELALVLRISHKYGKAGAQVLSSMGALEHLGLCKALHMPMKGSFRRAETRFGKELTVDVNRQQVIVAPMLRLVLSLSSLVDATDYFEVKNKVVREVIEFVKAHPALFDWALNENISEANEMVMELINLVIAILSKVKGISNFVLDILQNRASRLLTVRVWRWCVAAFISDGGWIRSGGGAVDSHGLLVHGGYLVGGGEWGSGGGGGGGLAGAGDMGNWLGWRWCCG